MNELSGLMFSLAECWQQRLALLQRVQELEKELAQYRKDDEASRVNSSS